MADSEQPNLRVFNIAAGQDFLAALARGLADEATRQRLFGACALEDVQILLPTRRAARQMAAAFLALAEQQGRQAVLLPKIETLGDLDETDEPIGDATVQADLPPAIEPMARHFHLLPLVSKWAELTGFGAAETGGGLNPVKLSALAYDLENFLDQAQNEQIDLSLLPDLAPDDLAENWQQTLGLLNVVSDYWPTHLAETGQMDPTARRNALLAEKRKKWAATPPAHPVIAAGSTGSIRATADLLKLIAALPRGAVVLPGLDMQADADIWQAIEKDVSHPQNMLARLIAHIGVPRRAIAAWPGSAAASPRADLFNLALVPAVATAQWQKRQTDFSPALTACHLIEAADIRAEAGAIALVMRETLETPNKTAALVTRDRNLARRVAAELRRWQIDIDDSAGRPLSHFPAARLLRLALACPADGFEPVGLLALLKHPFAHLGQPRGAHLSLVRALETALLRGPQPPAGLDGLRAHLRAAPAFTRPRTADAAPMVASMEASMAALIDRLAAAYAPLIALPEAASLSARLQALMHCVGHLTAEESPHDEPAAQQAAAQTLLDDSEEGRALAALMGLLSAHSEAAPAMAMADFPALMDMWLARQTVRRPLNRAPRLAILGPLEARLMQADVMILGGLNETVWPPMPETGPWLSRPMRAALGMSQPERQIGQAAHDFVQAAAAPELYLTRAEKIDGAPSMAARWLRRLQTLCGGLPSEKAQKLLHYWQALDAVADPQPTAKPQPTPPLAARPDALSVTQIETLLYNPYEIYARKILGLRPLPPVSMPTHAGHRGTFLHQLLETHIADGAHRHADAAARFLATADKIRRGMPGGAEALRFWRARLQALADWLAAQEQERAETVAASHVEWRGRMQLEAGGRPFTVTAKADRIDRLHSGRFELIDYKTGALPSQKSVRDHLAPQLTLEAAILRHGAFAAGNGGDRLADDTHGLSGETQNPSGETQSLSGETQSIAYWHLTGRDPAGEVRQWPVDAEMIDGAVDMVARLIAAYRQENQPYHVHIRTRAAGEKPVLAERPFDHLARLPEWQNSGGDA